MWNGGEARLTAVSGVNSCVLHLTAKLQTWLMPMMMMMMMVWYGLTSHSTHFKSHWWWLQLWRMHAALYLPWNQRWLVVVLDEEDRYPGRHHCRLTCYLLLYRKNCRDVDHSKHSTAQSHTQCMPQQLTHYIYYIRHGSCFTRRLSLCLSVCLLATSRKNYYENFTYKMIREHNTTFRKTATSGSGFRNFLKDI